MMINRIVLSCLLALVVLPAAGMTHTACAYLRSESPVPVTPAEAGVQSFPDVLWIPAFAGMTKREYPSKPWEF